MYNCDWKDASGTLWTDRAYGRWHSFPNGISAYCHGGGCTVKNPATETEVSWNYWGNQNFMNINVKHRQKSGGEVGRCMSTDSQSFFSTYPPVNGDVPDSNSKPYNGKRSIMQCAAPSPADWDVRHHGWGGRWDTNSAPGRSDGWGHSGSLRTNTYPPKWASHDRDGSAWNPMYRFQQVRARALARQEQSTMAKAPAADGDGGAGWGVALEAACRNTTLNPGLWTMGHGDCVKANDNPNFAPAIENMGAECDVQKVPTTTIPGAKAADRRRRLLNDDSESTEAQDVKSYCDCMFDVCTTADRQQAGFALAADEAAVDEDDDFQNEVNSNHDPAVVAQRAVDAAQDPQGTEEGQAALQALTPV